MPKKVLLTISDDESETYLSAVDQKKTAYVSGAGSSSDSDSGDDSKSCAVCLEDMNDPTPLGCGHTFCFPCISSWSKVTNLCPLCKFRFNFLTSKGGQEMAVADIDQITHYPDMFADMVCEICHSGDREHELLLCDCCEKG